MEIQQYIITLGHFPLTSMQIFSIDWQLCLEQLNRLQLSGEDECEDDFVGEYMM